MSTFLNVPLPLWAFLLLSIGAIGEVAWFAWLAAKERKSRVEADQLLKQVNDALEIGPAELQELNRDYATLGTLLEDHTQQFADIQKELFSLDERLSKLEQRSTHIHIGISKLFQVCEDDDEEDEDDECGPIHPNCQCDGDTVTLLPLLPGWLDSAREGLDEL